MICCGYIPMFMNYNCHQDQNKCYKALLDLVQHTITIHTQDMSERKHNTVSCYRKLINSSVSVVGHITQP